VTPHGPVPVELQHWADAFGRGNHYDAVYDRAAAERYLARNRATSAVLIAVGVVSLLACVLIVVFGGGFTRVLVVLGLVGLVAMLVTLPTIVSVGKRLRRAHAGDGIFARVSASGVSFGLVGTITWDEVLAVVVFDDTARLERTLRIPVLAWGARVSKKAGNGAVGLSIAVRDGSEVRARIRDERERGFVRLWGPKNDPARRGDISLILDPLLDGPGATALTEAVVAAALLNGVPVQAPRSSAEYIKTLGRLLDPKWPAGI
jgi:hypothetical protein